MECAQGTDRTTHPDDRLRRPCLDRKRRRLVRGFAGGVGKVSVRKARQVQEAFRAGLREGV
jgi:hypothetical protein